MDKVKIYFWYNGNNGRVIYDICVMGTGTLSRIRYKEKLIEISGMSHMVYTIGHPPNG